jgi:hypothetical protein
MNAGFTISIEDWIPDDETSDPHIRGTAAEISIKVGAYCATEVDDRRAKTVRKSIRVSAGLLASWLISNWWRLRWEPVKESGKSERLDWELSHSLAAAGGGYVWPPLILASDGANILLRCEAQRGSDSSELEPIRYLNSFAESITSRSFERSVSDFIEAVLERLNSTGHRHSVIHELWAETTAERKNSEHISKRKLEALLGLDPEEDDSLVADLLDRWQRQVGGSALEEIAAATERTRVDKVLGAAEQAAAGVENLATICDFHKLRTQVRLLGSGMLPWQLGRRAAYIVRDAWGFGMKPISTTKMADRLQVSAAILSEDQAQTPFSFAVSGGTEDQVSMVLSRRHQHSRRFDVARLIGDHLVIENDDAWKPATRSLTSRQKFQRAFAAEFLCPSDELERRYTRGVELDDLDDAMSKISDEYGVSQTIVLNHFANRGVIPRSLGSDGQPGFVEDTSY